MNRAFWMGVYPGLTAPMRAYVVRELRAAVHGPPADAGGPG